MKKIIINSVKHGVKEVLVDDEDYDILIKYTWCVIKKDGCFYAQRSYRTGGFMKTIHMHRFIMKTKDNMVCDHINHDTIDNRKKNLRNCSVKENGRNKKIIADCFSIYKGVSILTRRTNGRILNYYRSYIRVNYKLIHLGIFPYTLCGEIKAAKEYDKAAKKYFGEFAFVNFNGNKLNK